MPYPCSLASSLLNIQGAPTYTKITNTVSTTTVFGLCTCKWGIFALVGDPLQSHSRDFCIRRFFSSPKIRVKREHSVIDIKKILAEIYPFVYALTVLEDHCQLSQLCSPLYIYICIWYTKNDKRTWCAAVSLVLLAR